MQGKVQVGWAPACAGTTGFSVTREALRGIETREKFGAGNEVRTRDLNLGKVALYQLSYSRKQKQYFSFFLSDVNDSFSNVLFLNWLLHSKCLF